MYVIKLKDRSSYHKSYEEKATKDGKVDKSFKSTNMVEEAMAFHEYLAAEQYRSKRGLIDSTVVDSYDCMKNEIKKLRKKLLQ